MIVSPYNRNNPLPYSQITCLVISDEISPDGSYRKFSTKTVLLLLSFFGILQITEFIPRQSNLMENSVSSTRESLFAHHVVQPLSFYDFLLQWSPHCYHGHWVKTLQCSDNLQPASVYMRSWRHRRKQNRQNLFCFLEHFLVNAVSLSLQWHSNE